MTRAMFCVVLSVAVLAASGAPAQVTIAGVQGVVSEGQQISILGGGFGLKARAQPILYDDFQDGRAGEILMGEPVSAWVTLPSGGVMPTYSRTRERYSGDVTCVQSFGPRGTDYQSTCRLALIDPALDQVYFSGWVYLEDPLAAGTGSAASIRLLGHTGGGLSHPGGFKAYPLQGDGVGLLFSTGCTEGAAQVTRYGYGLPGRDCWHRVEYSRLVSGADETMTLAVDGRQVLDLTSPHGQCARAAFDLVPYFNGRDAGAAMDFHWSEVYMDSTRARVELGNAPVFEDCTHREVQVPETWNDTLVTVVVNQGTLTQDEPVYLFVVDGNGQASGGYQVDLDLGAPGPPVVRSISPQD